MSAFARRGAKAGAARLRHRLVVLPLLLMGLAACAPGCRGEPTPSPTVVPSRDGSDREHEVKRVRELADIVRSGDTAAAENAAVMLSRAEVQPASRAAAPVVLRRVMREKDDYRATVIARYAPIMAADWELLRRRPDLPRMSGDSYATIIMAPPGLLENFQRLPEVAAARRRLLEIIRRDPGDAAASNAVLLLPAYAATAEEAIPALVEVFARLARDEGHHMGSAAFFWAVGHYGDAATPLLLKLARAHDAHVRRAAIGFLVVADPWKGQFAPRSPEVVAELARLLAEDDAPAVRADAAAALGALGSSAMPAVPALTRALREDESGLVREAAQKALDSLRPPATTASAVAARGAIEPAAAPDRAAPSPPLATALQPDR